MTYREKQIPQDCPVEQLCRCFIFKKCFSPHVLRGQLLWFPFLTPLMNACAQTGRWQSPAVLLVLQHKPSQASPGLVSVATSSYARTWSLSLQNVSIKCISPQLRAFGHAESAVAYVQETSTETVRPPLALSAQVGNRITQIQSFHCMEMGTGGIPEPKPALQE